MDAQLIRDGVDAPMPWRRSLAFGSASVGVGVGGHALTSGHALHLLPVGLLFVAAVLLARVAASLRHRPAVIAVAAVLGQLATHFVLAATGGAHAAQSAASVAGSSHAAHHAHSAAMHASSTSEPAAAGMALLPMLLVHLVATVFGLVALLHLERRAWRVVATTARRVAAAVRSCFGVLVGAAALRPVDAPAPRHRGARTGTISSTAVAWLASTGVRRGPPALLGT